jgi:hypothetical protein
MDSLLYLLNSGIILTVEDQYGKTSGNHRRTWAGNILRRFGCFSEFSGGEINSMRFRIQRHGPGALLGLYIIDDCEFIRGVLTDDRECSVATIRTECQVSFRIESGRVGSFTDSNIRDNLAGLVIGYDHFFIPGHGKEEVMLAVDRQAGCFFAWSDRPCFENFQSLRVERCNGTLIFDVHEDIPFSIGLGKFRFSIQRYRPNY